MKKRLVEVEMQRDGRIFVHSLSTTPDGVHVFNGLPRVVGPETDAEEFGVILADALNDSNRRPLPERDLFLNPPDREFLDWLGVSTFGRYMRGVRSVGLFARYDNVLESVYVTPRRNEGNRGGFTPIMEERVLLDYESPEQLGRAVQEAMKKATR